MYRTLYSPQGAHINLDGRDIINMASNNYLGLANDPDLVAAAKEAIDKYGVGPSASRNIVGNFAIHDELEEALAKFKGVEAVLVFNSGVAARQHHRRLPSVPRKRKGISSYGSGKTGRNAERTHRGQKTVGC